MTTPNKQPKKTETLEVRLTPETKRSLRSKAAEDGVTLSEVIRILISDYISGERPIDQLGAEASDQSQGIRASFRKHPRKLSAIAASLIGGIAFLSFPAATAEPYTFEISGLVADMDADVRKTSKFDATLEMEKGDAISLRMGKDRTLELSLALLEVDADFYWLSIDIVDVETGEALLESPAKIGLTNEVDGRLTVGQISHPNEPEDQEPTLVSGIDLIARVKQ